MSNEGTTQDALKRLKQVDPERYAELMGETYDDKRWGWAFNGFHLGKFVLVLKRRDWRWYVGRGNREFRIVYRWGIGIGPIELRRKHL